MKEPTAEELYVFIDKFKDIYEYGQLVSEPKPDDVVTYYCNNDSGENGFVYNTKWKDGGFEKFIAKKWILQSDLDLLISSKNNDLKDYYDSDEVQEWMNSAMGTPKQYQTYVLDPKLEKIINENLNSYFYNRGEGLLEAMRHLSDYYDQYKSGTLEN